MTLLIDPKYLPTPLTRGHPPANGVLRAIVILLLPLMVRAMPAHADALPSLVLGHNIYGRMTFDFIQTIVAMLADPHRGRKIESRVLFGILCVASLGILIINTAKE
jgi:hypothetical protein